MNPNIIKFIIPLIKSAINGKLTPFEINQLVKFAHQFAAIRLTQLLKNQKITFDIYPHTINSVALDCIAEIFEMDEEDRFPELMIYFSNERDPYKVTEEQTLINFRTLVFSKLNDGIFRIYHENDPVTSKIIRNIKMSIKKSASIRTIERLGETFLSASEVINFHLPPFPHQELESELLHLLHKRVTIKTALSEMCRLLDNNSQYRNFISLLDAALILKSIYLKIDSVSPVSFTMDTDLLEMDIKSIVKNSIREINLLMEEKYLIKKKLADFEFNCYMKAISQLLTNTYIFNNGVELSYFDYLKENLPDLTYDEYRRKHRIQFEYIAKLSKKRVTENLKVAFE
mgnify:CR=1 FL=1